MKRCCARMVGTAMFFLCMLIFSASYAEEKAIAAGGDTVIGSILGLLREKNIITIDESAAFLRQSGGKAMPREDVKALVNLLREKGVISGEEAAGFVQKLSKTALTGEETGGAPEVPVTGESAGLIFPVDDVKLLAQLREKWVKSGNRRDEFDIVFIDTRDMAEIINRLRVMAVLSPAEADEFEELYRKKYLSGVVATVLEDKEKDYLERVRKNTAWEIDDKVQSKFKNEWFSKVRLSGDMRLRFEGDFFDPNNGDFLKPDKPTEIMNSKVDRYRGRIRARLGVDAKLTDEVSAGIGLATGNTNDPVSTNVTLGDTLNKKNILLDKAFLKWRPTDSVVVWGGRFANPWFYSDLVWDSDINFDGIAVNYNQKLTDAWSFFFNAGVFPIQEVELTTRDKWLFGGQIGMQYKRMDRLTAKLGVAFYDFENTVGVVNDPSLPGATDFTAPQFQQKGNTLMDIDPSNAIKTAYASEFRELNITGTLDIGVWDPIRVILLADYVKNLGFNKQDVFERIRTGTLTIDDMQKETEGYQLGLTVGYPKVLDFGEWNGFFFYKRLESDAVMDAFTDSDFHLGGTNAKGWIVGGNLGLAGNVWLTTRWLTANEISGPPLSIDVFQFDLNARF
ncbi:MAG: hypothetical protein FD174_1638 [Geobacteraceae bacterium]|nr:MAG: hypothetical protein FD174_1638 [Geobacteraceae bacterium]